MRQFLHISTYAVGLLAGFLWGTGCCPGVDRPTVGSYQLLNASDYPDWLNCAVRIDSMAISIDYELVSGEAVRIIFDFVEDYIPEDTNQ